jgi:hypothetical protein
VVTADTLRIFLPLEDVQSLYCFTLKTNQYSLMSWAGCSFEIATLIVNAKSSNILVSK